VQNALSIELDVALRHDTRVVVITDVVESVRLMEQHEQEFLRAWFSVLQDLRREMLPRHGGHLAKSRGDGCLLVFDNAGAAVEVSMRLHEKAAQAGGSLPIQLRTGIHLCQVVITELDVFGAGVNLAARLAELAEPGAILLSAAARAQVVDGLDIKIVDIGEHWLRHLSTPTRAYQVFDSRCQPPLPQVSRMDHLPAIAVLPFASRDEGDPSITLGHAIADDLTAAMSCSALWRVISRLSTAACRGYEPGSHLAQVLGVPYLVSGSYRRRGQALQLHVELCDARRDQVVWSDRFDLGIAELFSAQGQGLFEAVRRIARLVMDVEMGRASALPFSSLEDYSLYLSALALMYRLSRSDMERAGQLIDALRQRHRRSAEPLAMLSRWHALRMVQGLSDDPAQERQLAWDCARHAVDRDPFHAFALPMSALLAAQAGEPLDGALALARRALDMHPQEPMAGLAFAMVRGYQGDAAAFEYHCSQAVALSPLDPAIHVHMSMLASARLSAGRPEEAIDAAARALRSNATYTTAHLMMTAAQAMAGNIDAARESAARVLELEPDFSVSRYAAEFSGRCPPNMKQRKAALRSAGLPA
jgi:adenylate cyclase